MRKQPYSRTRGKLDTHYVAGSDVQTVVRKNQATVVTTTPFSALVPQAIGQQMTDVVTPGFAELLAQGKFINNPCYRYEGSYTIEPFTGLTYKETSYKTNPTTGTVLSSEIQTTNWVPNPSSSYFPAQSLPDIAELLYQASNEAAANSRQRDMMALVDIAEMRKTIDLIKTNLGRLDVLLNDSTKKLPRNTMMKKVYDKRTGKYRKVKSNIHEYESKTLRGQAADKAGLWLETQYGLLPLVSSINGLIKALGRQASMSEVGRTFRGSERLADTLDDTNIRNVSYGGGGSYQAEYRVITEFYQRARAGVITTYQPGLMGRLGMELSDIPTAAHELVRYSFVLDWFMDVGTYISALMSMADGGRRHSFSSTFQEVTTTWLYSRNTSTYRNTSTQVDYLVPAASCSMQVTNRIYRRRPHISVRLPKPDFHLKSLTHLVSGISLMLSNTNTRSLARI